MTEPLSGAVLECHDLSIRWTPSSRRAVDGVSLTLAAGRSMVIMGGAGSGKSTLAALLGGADRGLTVTGGDARIVGTSVRARGVARRVRIFRTGYLAAGAGDALEPRQTVNDIISAPLTTRDARIDARAVALRVAGLLDELHLPLGLASKYPFELSAGMRQRVALAQALILDPPLFIGDDPFTHLDAETTTVAEQALRRRRDDTSMAMLLAAHHAEIIDDLDADVIVLRRGAPVAVGHGQKDLLWNPDTPPFEVKRVTSTL